MSKRKEFQYGKEIRMVSPINQKSKNFRVKNGGKLVKTNLQTLVDEIIISPNSDDCFVDLVKETTISYNLNKKVYKSKIYEKFDN